MNALSKNFQSTIRLILAYFLIVVAAHAQQSPQSLTLGDQVFAMAKTDQGCAYYEVNEIKNLFRAAAGNLSSKKWSGACVIGLAEGLGRLELTQDTASRIKIIATLFLRFRAGLPVGYMMYQVRSVNPDGSAASTGDTQEYWTYSYGGQSVGGQGLGFVINEAHVSRKSVEVPAIFNGLFMIGGLSQANIYEQYGRLYGTTTSLILRGSNCTNFATLFKECEGQGGKFIYAASMGPKANPSTFSDPTARAQWTQQQLSQTCPNPSKIQGCEPMVNKFLAPIKSEVLGFISATRTNVESDISKSDALIASNK